MAHSVLASNTTYGLIANQALVYSESDRFMTRRHGQLGSDLVEVELSSARSDPKTLGNVLRR